jgi:hypothetical protein
MPNPDILFHVAQAETGTIPNSRGSHGSALARIRLPNDGMMEVVQNSSQSSFKNAYHDSRIGRESGDLFEPHGSPKRLAVVKCSMRCRGGQKPDDSGQADSTRNSGHSAIFTEG